MQRSVLLRLHFIVFLWGFTAVLGKLISVDAYRLTFFRMGFAALFLFISNRFILRNRMNISLRLLLQLFGVGSLMAGHWILFFLSIKVANVAIALSCMSLSTLFAALIEPLIFGRRVDLREIIIGIIIVGCILLIFNAEMEYEMGIMYGIICALLGTLFSVLNGKMYGRTASGNIIFYEIFGGTVVLFFYFLLTGQGEILDMSEISWQNLSLIVLLSGVFTAYPMLESVNLMKYLSPFTIILTVNLEPVYGIVLAYLIFGETEHMTPVFYLSAGVMIFSIFANGYLKAKRKLKRH